MSLVEEKRAPEHLRQAAAGPFGELGGRLLAIDRRLRLDPDLDELVRQQRRAGGGDQGVGDPFLADMNDRSEFVSESTQVAGGAAGDGGGHPRLVTERPGERARRPARPRRWD